MRIPVDLDLLAYESGYLAIFRSAFGIEASPAAVWQPVPPGSAALKHLLRHAKLGRPLERWFSQTDPGWRGGSLRYATFTRATLAMARMHGRGYAFPGPEYTPPADAARVARWAAAVKRRGKQAAVYTTASAAVRVCRAAEEHRLDVAGTFFRVAGEPYTRARADVLAAVGARAASSYYISDLGGLAGLPCAAPEALDDVHVPTDKLAVIQRPKAVGRSTVDLLVFTALHPLAPKVYINLEADDFGVLRERRCGCAVEQAGLGSLHVHGIRSHQKLTSDGMSFLGEDVVTLVEQVLPSRLGGSATDYQLVETEEGGLPRISVVVHPAVGDLVEDEVIEAVSSFLRSRGQGLAAEMWSAGGTLRVVRREPYSTAAGKLPVVHVLDGAPR